MRGVRHRFRIPDDTDDLVTYIHLWAIYSPNPPFLAGLYPPTNMGENDTVRYDPFTFRKHFKNIGRAYREQATTLIEMCRLYADAAPKTYTEDDRLQK